MHGTTGQTTRRAAHGAIVAALAGLVLSVAAVSPASGTGESVDREIGGIGHGVVVTTYGVPATFVGDERAELSHLGDSTIYVQGTSTSTETGVELAGTAVIVAANGDELRSTFRGPGTLTRSGLEATVVGVVTGGTGRFEHASGTITDHVVLTVTDVSPPTVTANATSTLSGTVDYERHLCTRGFRSGSPSGACRPCRLNGAGSRARPTAVLPRPRRARRTWDRA